MVNAAWSNRLALIGQDFWGQISPSSEGVRMDAKGRFILAAVMSAVMVFMVTLLVTLLNLGLRADFLYQWAKA
jgi:hypothetical protein